MPLPIMDRTTPGRGQPVALGRPANYQITVRNTGTDGQTYGGAVFVEASNDGRGWFTIFSLVVQSSTGFIVSANRNDAGAWDFVRGGISGMDANARITITAQPVPE